MSFNNSMIDDSELSLQNQNIPVTRVSRPHGIGRAIAKRCAKAGARVAVHGYPIYDMRMKYNDAVDNSTVDFVRETSDKDYDITALTPSDMQGG